MKLLLANPNKFNEVQINEFEKLGYSIFKWNNELEVLSEDFYDSDVVVCNSLFVHNDISHFNNLKMIQLMSVGLDRVPLEEIEKRGIRLENAGDIYSIPMAEWVILKILELYKDTRHFERAQIEREWEKNRNLVELNGKVIGILGTGNVGVEVSKRIKAFGVKTIGFNTSGKIAYSFDICYKIERLMSTLENIDILVVALPLSKTTINLVNNRVFKAMKKNAILINVSRGGIVNESNLVQAMNQGEFQAAALDVFSEEPLPKDSPLWGNSKVLISPHNSFVSDNTSERLFQLIYKNLSSFIS